MAIHKIDGVDGVDNFPKKTVTLYASGACTAGMFVALTADDTNGLGASCANAPLGAGAATASGLEPKLSPLAQLLLFKLLASMKMHTSPQGPTLASPSLVHLAVERLGWPVFGLRQHSMTQLSPLLLRTTP